jgi:excisionase family DNA binding protein
MVDEILTSEEVCKYLKIPRSSLYKLAGDKEIPAFKVGRHWRFKKEKLDAWLEKQENIETK